MTGFRRNAFGTRKEAKVPPERDAVHQKTIGGKPFKIFNARDESSTSRVFDRSLMPLYGAIRAIKSPVKVSDPLCISPFQGEKKNRAILLNFASTRTTRHHIGNSRGAIPITQIYRR